MTRRITLQLAAIVSDDGTRCARECPHVVRAVGQGDCDECAAFTDILSFTDGANVRLRACIAAEQAAASVPSCEVKP